MPEHAGKADPLQSLLDAARRSGDGLPPVELWEPDYCGEMDMVIRRDGSWWHEGRRITRDRLTRLFARILRKDDDGVHYLVTPVEKIGITVEVAPFLAIRMDRIGDGCDQVLVFETNMGDLVELGTDHGFTLCEAEDGQPVPLIHVRGRLQALLSRPVFYELVDLMGEHQGRDGIWSGGVFFPLESAT